jgi:hypothetical protein
VSHPKGALQGAVAVNNRKKTGHRRAEGRFFRRLARLAPEKTTKNKRRRLTDAAQRRASHRAIRFQAQFWMMQFR